MFHAVFNDLISSDRVQPFMSVERGGKYVILPVLKYCPGKETGGSI